MTIRKTTMQDFDAVCGIYADARVFMREHGNPDQWMDDWPTPTITSRDIESGHSYVCVRDGEIAAVFYFSIETEPTYGEIDGQWLDDEPYGVVHRLARNRSAAGNGASGHCLQWCFEHCGNIRIDTHRDNAPMRELLDRNGYSYCGIIWVETGDERMAFQKH